MSKKEKIWLGFLAFTPFIAAVMVNGIIAKNFTYILGSVFGDTSAEEILAVTFRDYSLAFIFWGISCILSLVQKVVYVVLAIKNNNLKRTIKVLYVICMVFFEIAVMIYFYLEILHGKKIKKDGEEDSVWID